MTTTVKYMGKGITPDNNQKTVKILKEIPAAQVSARRVQNGANQG